MTIVITESETSQTTKEAKYTKEGGRKRLCGMLSPEKSNFLSFISFVYFVFFVVLPCLSFPIELLGKTTPTLALSPSP